MAIIINVVKVILSSVMVLFIILVGIWALGGLAVAQEGFSTETAR